MKPQRVDTWIASRVRGPRADGRHYWRIYDSAERPRRYVWTGWATPGEAKARAHAYARPVEAPAPVEQELAGVETMRDLLELFIGAQVSRSDAKATTITTHRQRAAHLAAHLGHVPIQAFGRAPVDRWIVEQRAAGAAELTIIGRLAVLRHAWSWGARERLIPPRPVDWPRLRPPYLEHYAPTADQVRAVLALLRPWARAAMRLQWVTGARIGEILGARVRDVLPEGRALRVDGKTGPRTIPIIASARRELLALAAGRELDELLIDTGNPAAAVQRLAHQVARACKKLGYQRWTSHALRRHAVDAMLEAGVDIGAACQITGHSPVTMIQHYRRASLASRERALELAIVPLDDELDTSPEAQRA